MDLNAAIRRVVDKYAHRPNVDKAKHFTLVLLKGRLITVGWNKELNPQADRRINRSEYTRHAEIHALRRLMAHLRNSPRPSLPRYTFFNVRLDKMGQYQLARPCATCWKVLGAAGISKVYYTTGQPEIGRCRPV